MSLEQKALFLLRNLWDFENLATGWSKWSLNLSIFFHLSLCFGGFFCLTQANIMYLMVQGSIPGISQKWWLRSMSLDSPRYRWEPRHRFPSCCFCRPSLVFPVASELDRKSPSKTNIRQLWALLRSSHGSARKHCILWPFLKIPPEAFPHSLATEGKSGGVSLS